MGGLTGKELHPAYSITSAPLGKGRDLVPKEETPSLVPTRPLTPSSVMK